MSDSDYEESCDLKTLEEVIGGLGFKLQNSKYK